jgi:hypothetical protein
MSRCNDISLIFLVIVKIETHISQYCYSCRHTLYVFLLENPSLNIKCYLQRFTSNK